MTTAGSFTGTVPACSPVRWHRAILLVDMNAFFASVEQRDYPELQGRPVVITNGERGTCIITASYEARAYGIKTGMRLQEAKQCCPHLVHCPSHPHRYAETSTAIMEALRTLTPDLEVFSVDEAFLDVTRCQQLLGTPVRIGRLAQKRVFEASGVLCSIGISGDKTTAKYAAKLQKPNGFTVIPPWESRQRLQHVPVTELCGISDGIGRFLARYGAYTCGDVVKLPISLLAKRLGNIGRRIWYMCQGLDPESVHTTVGDPKSMGHGKVMPPNTIDPVVINNYLTHMSEKLGTRLRRHQMQAQHFFIGLRSREIGWIGGRTKTIIPTNDSYTIYKTAKQFLDQYWHQEPVWQIQLTALDPTASHQQMDLFTQESNSIYERNHLVDEVNERFGQYSLVPAKLIERSSMPDVIAPAWKPDGHRQTIQK